MKSNMEYLREFLEGKDEAIEFLDAVAQDNEESLEELKDEIADLKRDMDDKDEELSKLQEQLDEKPDYELETIDCGIGVIEYVQPDNIKLQMMMEEFKERVQHVALH